MNRIGQTDTGAHLIVMGNDELTNLLDLLDVVDRASLTLRSYLSTVHTTADRVPPRRDTVAPLPQRDLKPHKGGLESATAAPKPPPATAAKSAPQSKPKPATKTKPAAPAKDKPYTLTPHLVQVLVDNGGPATVQEIYEGYCALTGAAPCKDLRKKIGIALPTMKNKFQNVGHGTYDLVDRPLPPQVGPVPCSEAGREDPEGDRLLTLPAEQLDKAQCEHRLARARALGKSDQAARMRLIALVHQEA